MSPLRDAVASVTQAVLLARIDALTEALRTARDVIADERDLLLDSCTLGGDRSTMLADDAEEVTEFDALLDRIDAVLGDGPSFAPPPPDDTPSFHGFAKSRGRTP